MTKKKSLFFLLAAFASITTLSQRYIDRAGSASFFSEAPMENIEAHNNQAVSILDLDSKEIVVQVLMKSFKFEKALMQEHFNEKYVHSDKYPKAVFKGKLTGLEGVDLTKDGTYPVDVAGELTMHGKTNPINTKANLVVKSNKLSGSCDLPIRLKDYDIEILKVVAKNIAEVVDVKVAFDFQPQ